MTAKSRERRRGMGVEMPLIMLLTLIGADIALALYILPIALGG